MAMPAISSTAANQQVQLPFQNDVVDEIAVDERLRQNQHRVQQDNEHAKDALSPVFDDERAQIVEILSWR